MSKYYPDAEEGWSFWDRHVYGDQPTDGERYERYMVAMELLHTHQTLADSFERICKMTGVRTPMIINQACGDLLQAIANVLYTEPEIVRRQLIDLPLIEQGRKVWFMVQQARVPVPVDPMDKYDFEACGSI